METSFKVVGIDIWVNHFIELVLPKLKDEYIIFVDGKKPIGFETQIENFHFHGDDSKRSKKLLERVMKYTSYT